VKTTLVSFATPELSGLQEAQARSAVAVGGFDEVVAWDAARLGQTRFFAEHSRILGQSRGSGYWLWKPFVILDTLRKSQPGDVVVYYDVGRRHPHLFRTPIEPLLERCVTNGGLIPGVHIPLAGPSRRWTKRDCFVLMDCDSPKYWDACQVQASFSMWQSCARVKEFVEEWLAFCTDPRILTDMPNQCGEENFPDFIDHRHDQSVLTNLVIKHAIPCLGDQKRHTPFSKDINWAIRRVRMPLLCGLFDAAYRGGRALRNAITRSERS